MISLIGYKIEHGLNEIDDIFEGFKFMLLVTIGCLTSPFLSSDPFNLQEDKIYRIATSRGIPLEEIPNTCEKTVFKKKLWKVAEGIRRLENWNDLSTKLDEIKRLSSLYSVLIDKATLNNDNYEKGLILDYITADMLLVLFHDTKRGFPLALTQLDTSIYELYKRPFYLEKTIRGYIFTLQFIWARIFQDGFTKYSIKNLHEILQTSVDELENIQNPILEEIKELFGSDSSIDSGLLEEIESCERSRPKTLREELRKEYFNARSIEKNQERFSKILEAQKLWFVLDRYFDLVNDEIIKPIEDQLGIKSSSDSFFHIKDIKELDIDYYLPGDLKQPLYLTKNDSLSIKKTLDYFFLWHHVAVLDAQAGFTFNGVYAFVTSLLGVIELKNRTNNSEKIEIRIFKHPARGDFQHYYSFGILLEPYYGLHGASGWIIYNYCATDFSGTGDRLRSFAYDYIEKYKSKGIIEVAEFKVEKELFEEYLKEKSMSFVFDKVIFYEPMAKFTSKGIRELKIEYESIISNFKGKFFEFIVYKWLNHNKSPIKTFCDIYINGEQIDCLCLTKNNTVEFYECKYDLHDNKIHKTIQQINRKLNTIKNIYPNQETISFDIF